MRSLLGKSIIVLGVLCTSLSAFASTSQSNVAKRLQEPVKTTKLSNGILIEHFIEGTGSHPMARDRVTVHYLGRFPDGKVFDSSYARQEPSSFYLKDVIPCWTQGLQQIKVGGYARIGCPDHLAYGSQGVPGAIPPNSILFFDVELLDIN